MSSYNISLEDDLERRNKTLFNKYKTICESLTNILPYNQTKFEYYTPHGKSHSERIISCLNWLIYDKLKEDKLSDYEIYFLLLSAWLHDTGMICSQEEYKRLSQEEIRDIHHIRSEEFINNFHDKLNLTQSEAMIIGKISKGHRKIDLSNSLYDEIAFKQGYPIKIRFLAALLRLGDEFDITDERISYVIFDLLEKDSIANTEFTKHLSISGVTYPSDGSKYKVIFTATVKNPKDAELIKQFHNKLNSTVKEIIPILKRNGMELETIELHLITQGFIDKPIKFKLTESKIVDLLIGSDFYEEKTVAFREIIQNSVDAINRCKIFHPERDFKITIIQHDEENIEIIDNGDGMDFKTVKELLSELGSSFSNTTESDELKEKYNLELISKFGIGILSCFLIADKIKIESKKDGYDPVKFTIDDSSKNWKYQKGNLRDSGTSVHLKLKKDFIGINIEETLKQYVILPEYPIELNLMNGRIFRYLKNIDIKDIANNFKKKLMYNPSEDKYKEIVEDPIEIENEEFNLCCWSDEKDLIIVLNHGFFVGKFNHLSKFFKGIIILNLKKGIVDFDLSRTKIIRNKKIEKLTYMVDFEIIESLKRKSKNMLDLYISHKNICHQQKPIIFGC